MKLLCYLQMNAGVVKFNNNNNTFYILYFYLHSYCFAKCYTFFWVFYFCFCFISFFLICFHGAISAITVELRSVYVSIHFCLRLSPFQHIRKREQSKLSICKMQNINQFVTTMFDTFRLKMYPLYFQVLSF